MKKAAEKKAKTTIKQEEIETGTAQKADPTKRKRPVKKPLQADIIIPTEAEIKIPTEAPEEKAKIDRMLSFLNGKYDFRINVVTDAVEWRKKREQQDFSICNLNNLTYQLLSARFTKVKEELNVIFACDNLIERYDPFTEYFSKLPPWNFNDPDYISQLASYVVTDHQSWWEYMFKKHLVRCVSQATGGSGFNKQCLTLVGKQNDGKTRFFDFLAPEPLQGYIKKGFTFGSKEGLFSLTQNFLINLDELASFEKKELNNEFKSVLSESLVRYTPKFANQETTVLRRASFVASTNQNEFLTDETGNVRWIPFVVHSINHDFGGSKGYGANVDINKVWAQAYALLKCGFDHQLTPIEIEQQELYNKKFMKVSDEMDVLLRFLRPGRKEDFEAEFMTATQIGEYLRMKSSTRLYPNNLGRAIKAAGFIAETDYDKAKRFSVKGYHVIKL
jgi:predicted P-loop ATPase